MKKFLALALVTTINPLTAQDVPTIGKRLVNIAEHGTYGLSAGVAASIAGYIALAADHAQRARVQITATQEFRQLNFPPAIEQLFMLGNPFFEQQGAPQLLLGATIACAVVALYHAYKVVENGFGLVRDRL